MMLKKALQGVMPDELINREPHGAFGPLLERGFKDKEVERLEGLMSDSRLERMGVIDASMVLTRYRAYRAGDVSQFRWLFWTFAAEEWMKTRISP